MEKDFSNDVGNHTTLSDGSAEIIDNTSKDTKGVMPKEVDDLTVAELQPEENQPYVGWKKTRIEMPYKPWKYSNSKWNYTTLSDGSAAIKGYTGDDVKMVIPNKIDGLTVTEIAYKAFFDNEDIVSVTIPDTVKKIGESAFCGCCCLSEVIIPETVEEIGEEAFHDCPCLADDNGFVIVRDVLYEYFGESEKVTVPDGVKTIGCYCFSGDDIITITLPDSVSKIEESAFYLCKYLCVIDVPNPECKIDSSIFDGCSAMIQKGEWNYTILDDNTAAIRKYMGEDTKIIIPDEIGGLPVTEIVRWAFREQNNIVSVALPDTIRKIGDAAFSGCSGLADENGLVIIRNTLYGYFGDAETVTVPDGVERIGYQCFAENEKIKEVILPETVYKIGSGAFEGCTELRRVRLPDTLKVIGNRAFVGCYNLEDMVIPETVETIGDGAFCDCGSLADDNGFIIFKNVLHGYFGNANIVTVPPGIEKIDDDCFSDCPRLRKVILPDSVYKIGVYSFGHCRQLAPLKISVPECEIERQIIRALPSHAECEVKGQIFRLYYPEQ